MTMVPDSTVDLTAISATPTLQAPDNNSGRRKVRLPYDLLWKIFVDFVIPHEPDDAEAKLRQFIELRSVCKDWAIVLKQLLFNYVKIGHENWPQMHREQHAPLMDSQSLGPTIRHCIRVLRWSVTSSSAALRDGWRRRHIAMKDFMRLPSLSTVHVMGEPLDDTGSPEVYGSLFEEDHEMILFIRHHLHTGTLTILTFSTVMNIPLSDILASPSLQLLRLQDSSYKDYQGSPTPHDLEHGYNLTELVIEGTLPPMELINHLRKLRSVSIYIQNCPFRDFDPELVQQPYRNLKSMLFACNLDDFHHIFGVAASKRAGVEFFPNLAHLIISDKPESTRMTSENRNFNVLAAEARSWLGCQPDEPSLALQSLETLVLNQQDWFLNGYSSRVSVAKSPSSILEYLGVPTCSNMRSILVYSPKLNMSDSLQEPRWGYQTYMEDMQCALKRIAAATNLYPQGSRITSDLKSVIVYTQLEGVCSEVDVLPYRYSRVIRESFWDFMRCASKYLADVETEVLVRSRIGQVNSHPAIAWTVDEYDELGDEMLGEALTDSVDLRAGFFVDHQ